MPATIGCLVSSDALGLLLGENAGAIFLPPGMTAMAKTASCFACHQNNGAADTTFTQFYPTLAEPGAK